MAHAGVSHRTQADDMRARPYEMMAKFEDPYGDVQALNSMGQPPKPLWRAAVAG